MKIAIIGTGNVGGALATRWASAGHTILLGVRQNQTFKGQHLLQNPNTQAYSLPECAEKADTLLIAAAPEACQEIAALIQPFVKGKVVIDAMNSIRTRPEGFANSFEALRHYLPESEVVKCFNTTGFENMANPVYEGQGIDMFMAGDSRLGKQTAQKLALEAGFGECWDFGGDERVALLEQLALAWINLAIFQGKGRNIAFRVLKREITP